MCHPGNILDKPDAKSFTFALSPLLCVPVPILGLTEGRITGVRAGAFQVSAAKVWVFVVAVLLSAPRLALAAEGSSFWIDELRVGGAIAANSGATSAFAHVEALFAPLPQVATYDPTIAWLMTPRPLVGATLSLQGRTNKFFAGFAWSPPVPAPFLLEVSFGGLVHDQRLFENYPDRPELTTRFLFREAIAIGIELDQDWRLMAFADHGSNGNLGYRNASVNHVGIMLGGKLAPRSQEKLTAPSVANFSWEGPYAGLNAGIAMGTFNFVIIEPLAADLPVNESNHSVNIGGQAGYNLVFGPIVTGVETSFSTQALTSSAFRQQPIDEQISAAAYWLATARLRIGFDAPILAHRFLIYATGGAAFARVAKSYCEPPGPCYTNGEIAAGWITEGGVRTGWTAGAGLETALAPGISTKAEYLYASFGKLSYFNGPIRNDLEFREHIFRAGINFYLVGN